MNFVNTMFLAFLIDQIQQANCQKFKKLLVLVRRKRRIWEKIRSVFDLLLFEDWDDFWAQALCEKPPNTG